MMPTTDERRQVAVWLRDVADAVLPDSADDDVLGAIARSLHAGETPMNYEVLLRLADLIEPLPERTCHVVSAIRYDYELGYAGTEYITELSCGHKHTDSYGDAPNFCSECGSRVIE